MVLEKPVLPYWEWLSSTALPFLVALLGLCALGVLFSFLVVTIRRGPAVALRQVFGSVQMAVGELFQTSPRRLLAIARLAFQEAIRRRVLIVFVIFVFALLFGGWFLDRDSDHPARLYLSFVLTSTNYLVLLLAIFISAFSLPNDMKYKTIFTVVTKPVRGWEIIVGRIIGFVGIGTLLLGLMCVFSYFFVVRGLQHRHTADTAQMVSVPDGPPGTRLGQTSNEHRHRHDYQVGSNGTIVVTPTRDHTHAPRNPAAVSDGRRLDFGTSRGALEAKVPIRGELRFLDAKGNYLDASGQLIQGTNVGYEWDYRRYIEGGTLAAAIWRFKGLKPEDFGDTLPIEMTLRVFRTFKGKMDEGIRGSISLVKPAPLDAEGSPTALDGGLKSVEKSFTAREYEAYQPRIPRVLNIIDDQGKEREVDIFEELVDPETGELEVWIRCLDPAQYLGMAPADLYLRANNRPFWFNFFKGYVSIWMQMVVVTCLGVASSTVLSGPVAMIATLSALIMGLFKQFVTDVATGDMPGGGPVESLVRIIKQWNQMAELESGIGTWLIQKVDAVLMLFVQGISYAMPNTGDFNTSQFVAYGFNIPGDMVAKLLTITLAYFVVISTAGYFLFKSREIAA